MFAYCGNNPVMFKDEYGTHLSASISVVYVNDAGDEVWYRPIDNTPPSEFAQEMDALVFDFAGATTFQEYFAVYDRAMQLDVFQNIKALGVIPTAIRNVITGLGMLCIPDPTPFNEIKGLYKMIKGSIDIIIYLGELIDREGVQRYEKME